MSKSKIKFIWRLEGWDNEGNKFTAYTAKYESGKEDIISRKCFEQNLTKFRSRNDLKTDDPRYMTAGH